MSVAADLTAGLVDARRGAALAWGTPAVRRLYLQLAAVLLSLSTALDVAGIWAVVAWTRGDGSEGFWAVLLLMLLRLAGIGIVLLVAPIVAMFLIQINVPLLGERVFLAGLRVLAPARADALAAAPGLPLSTTIANVVIRLLTFVGVTLLLLLLAWVPVVGAVLAPLLQAWRSAVALSWELLDPYFDRLGLQRAGQLALLRRHQVRLLGFALPFVFVMAIPIVGPLVFGLAQAAVAVVVVEAIEAPGSAAS
ncbi:MAG: EI24 domain-containing protein [Nannocystaceae bacterium]